MRRSICFRGWKLLLGRNRQKDGGVTGGGGEEEGGGDRGG